MRFTICKRILAGIAVLGLLGAAARAHALTAEVRDEAGFFTPETVARADEVIKEIKARHKKDLLVETFRHVPEGKQQEATSSDAKVKARFFADWADQRAREEGVNGIYVLITRSPGHVEVAVGNQTRTVFPDKERHQLSQILLSHFKKKEYDEGLLQSVRYVRSALAAEPKKRGASVPAGSERPSLRHDPRGADGGSGWGLWHWLGLGIAVLLSVWLLSGLIRALTGTGGPTTYGGSAGAAGPAGYGPAGGGGGFFPNFLGGLFGAAAGSWLYDRFSGGQSTAFDSAAAPATSSTTDSGVYDTDYTAEGGDFDATDRSDGDDLGDDSEDDDSHWGESDASDDSGGGGDFGGDDGGGGDF